MLTSILSLGIIAVSSAQVDFQTPPPIFEASTYTTWDKKSVDGSRRGQIYVPFKDAQGNDDFVSMLRLDLVGDAKARGHAHGKLLAKEIIDFTQVQLPKFFIESVLDFTMDTSDMPPALAKILSALKKGIAVKVPEILHEAQMWVYNNELKYMPQSLIDEMDGIAEGMCAGDHGLNHCDVNEWTEKIHAVNMLPELIRMACTAYGAWGKANNNPQINGGLVQVRALDFGTGPWSGNTVVNTARNEGQRAFASVSFPGFVGVITGISDGGVGISEKVWMVSGKKKDIQGGAYDGVPDPFVLRQILEHSATRQEAEIYVNSIHRTWAMFIGVGDFTSQQFDLIGYREQGAQIYSDQTITEVTSQPIMNQIAYVDKHPQPSGDDHLPSALSSLYGNLTAPNCRMVTQYHETGDVHIAFYDFANKQMLLSIGRTNSKGEYRPEGSDGDSNVWKAYNRPYIQFDLGKLFSGQI
jgi:hypothetical protein